MSGEAPAVRTAEEAQVAAELDELAADSPLVGIVMGSKSDMETMAKAGEELTARGIMHEIRVMSAHREPDTVADYAKNARLRGLRVIIAGAGISAALPGAVAAHTDLPVIGVPLSGPADRRRRPRRDPLDRADAPRSAGGLRRPGQPAQRRRPGRADPAGLTVGARAGAGCAAAAGARRRPGTARIVRA